MFISMVVAVLLGATPAAKSNPEDQPVFRADPAAWLAEAQAVAPSQAQDVLILFEDNGLTFDAAGRATHVRRLVMQLRSTAGIRASDTIGAEWSPWNQAPPEIEARVITRDGQVHALDPKTLVDGSAEREQGVLSDRKQRSGPLPALEPGCVVEQQITVRDTAPSFGAGTVRGLRVDSELPTLLQRTHVTAPASLPVRSQLLGTFWRPVEARQGDQVTWRVDRTRLGFGGVPPAEDGRRVGAHAGHLTAPDGDEPESSADDDAPGPVWMVSTGASWTAVATAYRALVDARLAEADLGAQAKEIAGATREPVAVLQKLLPWLRKHLRYSAVELGESAIVPRSATETLSRGYGDCKDMATLVVGLLRPLGVDARVALLRVCPGEPSATLPGLGLFDHAIVVVRTSDGQSLWVDPTQPLLEVGVLPFGDDDRPALEIAPDTTALIRTPRGAAAQNRMGVVREVALAVEGFGEVQERRAYTGGVALEQRSLASEDPARYRQAMEQMTARTLHAEAVSDFVVSEPDAPGPMTRSAHTRQSLLFRSAGGVASAQLELRGLFDAVPVPARDQLTHADARGGATAPPTEAELKWVLTPPERMVPVALPPPLDLVAGPAHLTREVRTLPSGQVEVVARLVTGAGVWRAALFAPMRALIDREFDAPARVTFSLPPQALLAKGQLREALQGFQALLAAEPGSGLVHLLYARALLKVGFGLPARAEAQRATELLPTWVSAWQTLAQARQTDSLGRWLQGDFDRKGALAALEKAAALSPLAQAWEQELPRARLLGTDAQGRRDSPQAQLEPARALYQKLREGDAKLTTAWPEELAAMLGLRRFEDVVAQVSARDPENVETEAALCTALAALRGGAAGYAAMKKRVPEEKQQREVVDLSVKHLVQLRSYPEALALVDALLVDQPSLAPGQAKRREMFKRMKRHEALQLDPAAPAALFGRTILSAAGLSKEKTADLYDERLRRESGEDPQEVLLQSFAQPTFDRSFSGSDATVDMAIAVFPQQAEGDPARGYRVKMVDPTDQTSTTWVWAVPGPSGLRALADPEHLWILGDEALKRAEAGDVAAAKQYLDWAREALGPQDEALTPSSAFMGLWPLGEGEGPDAVKLAASALAAQGRSEAAAARLERALPGRTPEEAARWSLALAAGAMRSEKLAEAERWGRRALGGAPSARAALSLLVDALLWQHKGAEAEALIQTTYAREPRSLRRAMLLLSAQRSQGHLAEALAIAAEQDALKPGGIFANERAWTALFLPGALTPDVLHALDLHLTSWPHDAAALHTQAAVFAELGQVEEARQSLLRTVAEHPLARPEVSDLYVQGRIAEQLGLAEVARGLYGKVLAAPSKHPSATDTAVLARQRLAVLTPVR